MFSDVDKEIAYVRGVVSARFSVYETRVTPQAVQFLVTVDPATMEARFEDLRKELVPKDYIPVLTKEKGEHSILVQRRAPQRFVGLQVNVVLFVLTVITTMMAGASVWAGYEDIDWLTPAAWAYGGLFFTLPLLAILGIHEMGHYVVAKRYQVRASLPFFIPAPGLILGTFGAMISMRDPLPNRKALLDVGASGPILGLLTAIPVTLLGFALTAANPHPIPLNSGGSAAINIPPLYQILSMIVPVPQDSLIHPMAFAGWVGLFVTALNLFPAGQLDGGHIARAVLGERAKYVSWGFLGLMFFLGLYFQYLGWLIIAMFILLLGARHPPPLNDLTRLDTKRHVFGVGMAAVFLLSFVAVPLYPIEPHTAIQFEAPGATGVPLTQLNASVARNGTNQTAFWIHNTGNVNTTVNLTLDLPNFPSNLNVSFVSLSVGNRSIPVETSYANFTFDATESANVTLAFDATGYTDSRTTLTFSVRARVMSDALNRPEDVALPVTLLVA